MSIIAMVWSSLFLALIVITALTVLVNSLRIHFLIKKDLLLINSSSKLSFTEGEKPAEILDLHLPRFMPFIFISYKLVSSEIKGRKLELESDLEEGLNEFYTDATSAFRGVYHTSPGAVELVSWFRFFVSRVHFPGEKVVTVLPQFEKPATILDYQENGGEISSSNKSVRKEEDLVDSRKYYPGDDPRKINWKHYARTDDLYIRQGEEGIPFQKKVLVMFDISNIKDSWEKTDILCRRCAAIIDDFSDEEIEISYLVPGSNKPKIYEKNQFLHALATLVPGSVSTFVPREKGEVWIFSISDSSINDSKWKSYKNRVKFIFPYIEGIKRKRGANVFEI